MMILFVLVDIMVYFIGMFALRKKIEESILSAEILTPIAIELEEARRIKQKELIRECNLWDDLAQANEVLVKFAESDKAVDALKDLRYKVICHAFMYFCNMENSSISWSLSLVFKFFLFPHSIFLKFFTVCLASVEILIQFCALCLRCNFERKFTYFFSQFKFSAG